MKQERARGKEYDELIEEFIHAMQDIYGKHVLLQFEDFANRMKSTSPTTQHSPTQHINSDSDSMLATQHLMMACVFCFASLWLC